MNTPTATVAIDDLRYAWPGKPALIDIPHLVIGAGERVFLEGPSGSGKSTLLGLLGGVLLPDAGRLAILGTEPARLRAGARDRFRADHIGFIFQQFNLVPYLGLVENVTLGCRFSPRRRQRLGARVNSEAERLLGALGLDVQSLRHHSVTELSVGQQQRVAAARALIGAPELVIADEPTSALDANARAAFIELLFGECGRAGSTLVFVSHDPALAPLFPRSLRLTDVNRAATPAEAA
ncbi:ATP-binding cassette domain-containing protein [Pseudofulvimonas gallinarii]|jgi:putative ABC transport system ATP-binding protein|uniref:Putative ABC transport system ATP-binding protein n=1 Tax=Pseudofulvimonas gallinarii TaxID=634155 RepID=A0A4V3UUL5_9GAMM|nr:ATP-binding cassette domain-containing protein [Pseudofulvimonas gallinarii]TCT01205.1 putative ABC transport system ATP-binding protein [Pseudofulvimonas gallinarii]THD14971.1 methionine ABC transporter ATP-binding protein [Pseudofulvimonas gallinarii]